MIFLVSLTGPVDHLNLFLISGAPKAESLRPDFCNLFSTMYLAIELSEGHDWSCTDSFTRIYSLVALKISIWVPCASNRL